LHGLWAAWVAAAVAERRMGRLAAARAALDAALDLAPGATAAHLELAEVLLALDDAGGAVGHAERVIALEGESPRSLSVLARALVADGRPDEARTIAQRLLAAQPDSEQARALVARLSAPRTRPSWSARLRAPWRAWKGR
jgi:predicted Zn-dependent protease